jgi:hypothetical protein
MFKFIKYFFDKKRKLKEKEDEIKRIILGNKTVEYDSNLLRDEEEIKNKHRNSSAKPVK